MPDIDSIDERVIAYQRNPASADFEELLGAVARYQFDWNPPLRRWWTSRGFDPTANPTLWPPAVPTDVFRSVELRSHERPARTVFRTSGTTSGARGQHHRLSTRAYDEGAILHFRRMSGVSEGSHDVLRLVFDDAEVPDSSLAHMVDLLERTFAGSRTPALLDPVQGVRLAEWEARLKRVAKPVVVFGTAFAFVELMDRWNASVTLPEGSMVIDTGGFKGRTREVSRPELVAMYGQRLGVPPAFCLSEYSMTELSSQLYTRERLTDGADSDYEAPHWLRVTAVDPVKLTALPDGEVGLLRFDDLANTDSVVSIQTSDLGRVFGDRVQYLGRASGATPRGCSLAIEEVLQARDSAAK
jgi:hypothetical protein